MKDAIDSFGLAKMQASLQCNMSAYAKAVLSADELVAKVSA